MKIALIYFICFYLSLPDFFNKAGYKSYLGLIPIYNIYLLCLILKIHPLLLAGLGLSLIFFPDRMLVATTIIVFLPFVIADAFSINMKMGILTALIPFIMYTVLAYIKGYYNYFEEEEKCHLSETTKLQQ